MVSCPTCEESFDNKHGMRIHHTQVHNEPLDNNVCDKCGESFYDERSNRKLCNSCDQIEEKPDGVEIPEDEDWQSLSPYQRYYYKNKEEEQNRTQQRRESIEEWYYNLKEELECENCAESHPATLQFHHRYPSEKEENVSWMVNNGYSKSRIEDEIQKCDVLCANCHAKQHSPK